jgi:hypothetical protein
MDLSSAGHGFDLAQTCEIHSGNHNIFLQRIVVERTHNVSSEMLVNMHRVG